MYKGNVVSEDYNEKIRNTKITASKIQVKHTLLTE